MIELVVFGEGQTQRLLFSKEMIIIGEGASQSVDLSFYGKGLHQNHLKIVQQHDGYVLINQANDPFVSLNGFPFHKKKLQPGDEILLHSIRIYVEEINGKKENSEIPPLDEPVEEESFPPVNFEQEKEEPKPENFEWDEIEKFLQTSEDVSESIPESHQENIIEEKQIIFDEEELEIHEMHPEDAEELPSFWRKNWKWIPAFILVIAIGASSIFFEMYLRASGNKEIQEIKAAEAVADVSMALTYAQLHQVIPQKNYWADPEFLKDNLQALLSSTSLPCTQVDAQGHLKQCAYFLRIYMSSDLSRFLLIAQPSPGLSQWIIPRDAIITDSHSMELRKIQDLKQINRLLADFNSLDGLHDEEITSILKNGKIISLFQLAERLKSSGFSPPKALAYIRPGAENYIYNSPRYHLIGHDILNQAATLSELAEEDAINEAFEKQIALISRFPDLVLYSSKGLLAAQEGRRALAKLAPKEKFLTAYLKVDSQGAVKSSHLIMDGDWEEEKVGTSHPIEGKLAQLSAERRDELKEISQKISDFIALDSNLESKNFERAYQDLMKTYADKRDQSSQKVLNALKEMKEKYQLEEDQFLIYLKHFGLDEIWQNNSLPLHAQDVHRFLLFLTKFSYSFSKELRGVSYSLESHSK